MSRELPALLLLLFEGDRRLERFSKWDSRDDTGLCSHKVHKGECQNHEGEAWARGNVVKMILLTIGALSVPSLLSFPLPSMAATTMIQSHNETEQPVHMI